MSFRAGRGRMSNTPSRETHMPKLRVHNFAISLDGYGGGPDQSLEHPLGVGGTHLHEWVFASSAGRQMMGEEGGTEGVDSDFIERGDVGIGATIMGRNMFGPIRGPWTDDEWKGWWGDNPPYHHEVFVLTHQPRASFAMDGGTTFHFVDDPIDVVLERAFAAADGRTRRRDASRGRAGVARQWRAPVRQRRRRQRWIRMRRARQLAVGRARSHRKEEGMTHITNLGNVAVPVTDQERARAFYVDTLGFEKRRDVPFGGDQRWIEVAPAGAVTTIALAPSPAPDKVGVDTGIRLNTTDATADHADLRALGVDTDPEVMRWPGVPPMFSFRDPDGNTLYIVEEP